MRPYLSQTQAHGSFSFTPGFAQKWGSVLDRVSTARGSGWVGNETCDIAIDFESEWLTHPLPRAVLTVSKLDQNFVQSRQRGSAVARALPQNSEINLGHSQYRER